MLSQEKEKKEIIKVLDNLDKFIVKGTVKKGRGRNKEYDEITIGRKTSRSFPEIDLSIYDQNKYLSRNHLAVLRLNDKYYARLLSSQNISYLNNSVMKYDEDYELKDGDKIILTKELGIIVRNI